MLYGHDGSSFKQTYELIKGRVGSSWDGKENWIKQSGVWRQLVPPNAIILYDHTISDGLIANGQTGTPNVLNKYIRSNRSTPLTTAGRATHEASEHGASELAYTNYKGNSKANSSNVGSNVNSHSTSSSHRHSVAVHTHTGTADNEYSMNWKSFIPYMHSTKIRSGAMILASAQINTSIMSYALEYVYYYLKLMAASQSHTAVAHTHQLLDIDTSVWTSSGRDNGGTRNVDRRHYHQAYHSLAGSFTNPPRRYLIPHKVTNDIWFDQLPLKSLILLTSNILPDGWGTYQDANSIIYTNPTTGSVGGSHTHPEAIVTTQEPTSYERYARSGTYNSEWRMNTHTHTFTDRHTGAVDPTPLNIGLVFAEKLA